MFRETREVPLSLWGNVRIVKPGHLIALKLFSTVSNPERAALDREDIAHLLHLKELDRNEIRTYFQKYSNLKALEELEGQSHD